MNFYEWILSKKTEKGGKGSGNFDHSGRPGLVGGSAPSNGRVSLGVEDVYSIGRIIRPFDDSEEVKAEYRRDVAKNVRAYIDKVGYKNLDDKTIRAMFVKKIDEIKSKYQTEEDAFKSDEMSNLFFINGKLKEEVDFRAKRDICNGSEDAEDLTDKDIWHNSHDNYFKPLPEELWHCTTDVESILVDGLKSRYERDASGTGLGGGEDDAICLTDREEYAKTIERSLHEMHMIYTGKLTPERMVELAKKGAGGVGHDWSGEFEDHIGSYMGKKPLQEYVDILNGKPYEHRVSFMGKSDIRPATEEERENLIHAFARSYMSARDHSGGLEDPMFMFNDVKAFKKLNPKNFKVLRLKPKNKKCQGHYVGHAEGEWRIYGGGAVDIDDEIDFFDPDDIDSIVGDVS